jgi:hypothetical protein
MDDIEQALNDIDDDAPTEQPTETLDTEEPTETLLDRLLSTEPDTPIEQISSPLDITGDGTNHLYRGVQKLGLDGIPAGIDILIGIALLLNQKLDAQPSNDDDTDNNEENNDVNITEMV